MEHKIILMNLKEEKQNCMPFINQKSTPPKIVTRESMLESEIQEDLVGNDLLQKLKMKHMDSKPVLKSFQLVLPNINDQNVDRSRVIMKMKNNDDVNILDCQNKGKEKKLKRLGKRQVLKVHKEVIKERLQDDVKQCEEQKQGVVEHYRKQSIKIEQPRIIERESQQNCNLFTKVQSQSQIVSKQFIIQVSRPESTANDIKGSKILSDFEEKTMGRLQSDRIDSDYYEYSTKEVQDLSERKQVSLDNETKMQDLLQQIQTRCKINEQKMKRNSGNYLEIPKTMKNSIARFCSLGKQVVIATQVQNQLFDSCSEKPLSSVNSERIDFHELSLEQKMMEELQKKRKDEENKIENMKNQNGNKIISKQNGEGKSIGSKLVQSLKVEGSQNNKKQVNVGINYMKMNDGLGLAQSSNMGKINKMGHSSLHDQSKKRESGYRNSQVKINEIQMRNIQNSVSVHSKNFKQIKKENQNFVIPKIHKKQNLQRTSKLGDRERNRKMQVSKLVAEARRC